MSIQVVSQWQLQTGKTITEVTGIAKDAAQIHKQYGASYMRLGQIRTGQNVGQFYTIISYDDYEAFAEAQDRLNNDQAYQAILRQANATAIMKDRQILESQEL